MEGMVKDKSCDELDYRTCGSHTEEQDHEVVLERFENPDGRIKAQSVNGAKRPCEESSVDELSFGDSVIDNFDHPADEAVNEEHHI